MPFYKLLKYDPRSLLAHPPEVGLAGAVEGTGLTGDVHNAGMTGVALGAAHPKGRYPQAILRSPRVECAGMEPKRNQGNGVASVLRRSEGTGSPGPAQ